MPTSSRRSIPRSSRPVNSNPSKERRWISRCPLRLAARINENNPQLKYGRGYDFNWVLNKKDNALDLQHEFRIRQAEESWKSYTTEPGIQFYSGNFLNGTTVGKGGKKYAHRFGFCLETQHYPDSPNKPIFPFNGTGPGSDLHIDNDLSVPGKITRLQH